MYSSHKSYSRGLCNFFDPLQDILLFSTVYCMKAVDYTISSDLNWGLK